MSAAVMFSLTAAALTAVCSVPQCHRALRQTAGLSVAAWLQGFALGLIWATYGLATQQWVLLGCVHQGVYSPSRGTWGSRLITLAVGRHLVMEQVEYCVPGSSCLGGVVAHPRNGSHRAGRVACCILG